ncbi:MAG: BTAD domain-containing putative transcriptional regulator [Nakamurella sp.]
MDIELIDRVALVSGARSRQIMGRRPQIVLAALALGGRTLSITELADALWGTDPPPTWPTAVRGVIRALRRTAETLSGDGRLLISTAATGYRLTQGHTLDVQRASADLELAREHLAGGRPHEALTLLAALRSVNGAQLLGQEDAEWLTPHRGGLDVIGIVASILTAEAALDAGDTELAVTTARTAVADHPLEESAHRVLIRALAAGGDRAGAVAAYGSCRRVLADQLGVDPSPRTVEVYLQVLGDAGSGRQTSIPQFASALVGRAAELDALLAALAPAAIVTLVGPRGIGKSRLAAEVARRLRAQQETAWSPLVDAGQDALVAGSVARDLGLVAAAGDPTAAIVQRAATTDRILLVLDGVDGVVDGAAALVQALREGAPSATLLTTCTRPLGVTGEVVIPVGPLSGAADGEPHDRSQEVDPAVLQRDPAVELLIDRTRSQGRALRVDRTTAPAIRTLCERAGGVPLALELAAAQLTLMAPGDLLDQLAEVAGDTDPSDRVRAFARYSYSQLDGAEAEVFRLLGVLGGPITLPFLRELLQHSRIDRLRLPRLLRELTDRTLVLLDAAGAHWSYDMDDDLRRLAAELLAENGDTTAALLAVADTLRALLPDDPRLPPAPYSGAIGAVRGTVRALFGAALEPDADPEIASRALDLAFRLHRWYAATDVGEGRYWLEQLIDAAPDSPVRPEAAFALGYLSYWAGDSERAVDQLGAVAELFSERDSPYLARALIYLAGVLDDLDRGDEAVTVIRRAIDAAQPFGVDLQVATSIGLGSILGERGEPEAARHAVRAVELCRAGGSPEQLAVTLPTAANICWQVGEIDTAATLVDEGLTALGGTRRIGRVIALGTATGVALARGDAAGAIAFGTVADEEGTEIGVDRELPHIRSLLALALLDAGDPDAAAQRSAAALDAAAQLDNDFPAAVALEVGAVVAGRLRAGQDPESVERLDSAVAGALRTAAAIRHRGARPVPAPLRARFGAEPTGAAGIRAQHGVQSSHDRRAACSTLAALLVRP